MRVELNVDEVWALLSSVTKEVIDSVELSDDDRAALRRWRSNEMRQTSDGMKTLTQKVNGDVERLIRQRERSAIQKHDWV